MSPIHLPPDLEFPRRPTHIGRYASLLSTGLLALFAAQILSADAVPFVVSDLHELEGIRRTAAGDLDGDGDFDLAVTSTTGDRLLWLENEGAIWSPRLVAPLTPGLNGAFDVAIGDLDGDGDLDIVSTARDAGTVDTWSNNGTGSSWTRTTVAATAPGARYLALGDIDRDGDLDIVAAVTGADDLRWWENKPVGWTGRVLEGTSGGVREIALGDIDEDGDLDVVGLAATVDEAAWWANPLQEPSGPSPRGTTGWDRTTIGTILDPGGLAVVDLDADGDPDVLAGEKTDDSVAFFSNDGPGSRNSWTRTLIGVAGQLVNPTSLRTTDFDRDGVLDVIGGSGDELAAGWFDRDADGTVTFHSFGVLGRAFPGFEPVDLDRDGDPDLVAVAEVDDGPEAVARLQNRSVGRDADFEVFDAAVNAFSASNGVDPALGDIDGDGDLDLVAIQDISSPTEFRLAWFENRHEADENGFGYLIRHDFPIDIDLRDPAGLDVGDLDGDGDVDVLIGEQGQLDRFVRFCENLDGRGGSWECSIHFPNDGSDGDWDVEGELRIADVDGDGRLDFVARVGSLSGPGLGRAGFTFFRNLGDLTVTNAFEPHQIVEQDGSNLRIADLDGDQDLDVVIDIASIRMYSNDNGGGTSWTENWVGSSKDFEVADVDLDGVTDIVTWGTVLNWYTWAGGGEFEEHVGPSTEELHPDAPAQTSFPAARPAIADLDGDGDPDLVTTYLVSPIGGPVEPGTVLWAENRLRESGGTSRGGTGWTLRPTSMPALAIEPVHVLDFDGDSRIDLGIDTGVTFEGIENTGASLEIEIEALAPATLSEGEESPLLAIDAFHRGQGFDPDLELTHWRLVFAEAGGDPLIQADIDALVGTIRLRQDDGDGIFQTSDPEIAAWASLPSTDGEVDLAPPPGSEPALDCCDTTERWFVTLEPATGATAALPASLEVRLPRLPAEARTQDTLLAVSTGPVDPDTAIGFSLDEGGPIDETIFTDDFESGGTTAWE